jgi:hypothetical protein
VRNIMTDRGLRRRFRLPAIAVVRARLASMLAVGGRASVSTTAFDDFNRADGSLGPDWTDMIDGGLAISSQMVIGTSVAYSGDIRTGETYANDQYSQINVKSTTLRSGQWIGPVVRAQNGGQNLYLGHCDWNNTNSQLMLFKRVNGIWTQLGASCPSGALAGDTQLSLTVVGSTLSFAQNGTPRITATDTSLLTGAPGIMAQGTAATDSWRGGAVPSGFQVDYVSTDENGVKTYSVVSDCNGYGAQTLCVLSPIHPAAGVAHNFLYVLPVEPGLESKYGDGLDTLCQLDAHNQYNLTIIKPSFACASWFADNPSDPQLQYESFMTNELVPWVKANLSTSGSEQNWLIGFSKSGYGGQHLLLRNPDLFTLGAAWDFPADMSSYNTYRDSATGYGSQANFMANYQLSASFLAAHRGAFVAKNRIWIGGYELFSPDMSKYDALLASAGILHTVGPSALRDHRWDSGWVPEALAALYKDSRSLDCEGAGSRR